MKNEDILTRMELNKVEDDFVYSIKVETWFTYGDIFAFAMIYKDTMKKNNMEEVIVCAENSLELFVVIFACMLGNIKLILIDPLKSEVEIKKILKNHLGVEIIYDLRTLGVYNKQKMTQEDMKKSLLQIDFEKIFLITYTSGSTGEAKGVCHTLKNLFWSAVEFGDMVGYNNKSVVCHTMPMTYMAGILNTILLPYIMNSKIVIFQRFSVVTAIGFWENVIKYKINVFWLSPTMLNMIMTVDRKETAKEYLAKRNTVFCIGTAALFPELKVKFEIKYGVVLLPSYGLSETLFISSEIPEAANQGNSVGRLLKSVDLRFSKDDEIKLNVPWMYKGYINQNDSEYFEEGYYLSGDLGKMENKNLYITGRKKDLIIRGGMNISPKQIEQAIYNTGRIKECVVLSIIVKNEERILCCYIPLSEVQNPNKILNGSVEEQLGNKYTIDYFYETEVIPKNLNGKIDKDKVRENYKRDDN